MSGESCPVTSSTAYVLAYSTMPLEIMTSIALLRKHRPGAKIHVLLMPRAEGISSEITPRRALSIAKIRELASMEDLAIGKIEAMPSGRLKFWGVSTEPWVDERTEAVRLNDTLQHLFADITTSSFYGIQLGSVPLIARQLADRVEYLPEEI